MELSPNVNLVSNQVGNDLLSGGNTLSLSVLQADMSLTVFVNMAPVTLNSTLKYYLYLTPGVACRVVPVG